MSFQDSYLRLARLLCYPEGKDELLESCDGLASHFRESGFDSPAAPFDALLREKTLMSPSSISARRVPFILGISSTATTRRRAPS
jgi:hypothetical protein